MKFRLFVASTLAVVLIGCHAAPPSGNTIKHARDPSPIGPPTKRARRLSISGEAQVPWIDDPGKKSQIIKLLESSTDFKAESHLQSNVDLPIIPYSCHPL